MEQQQQQIEKSSEMDNKSPIMSSAVAMLFRINPDHNLVKEYQIQYDKYLQNLKNQSESLENKKPEVILPELKPIDVESIYEVFKAAFNYFRGKHFDENVNDGEGLYVFKLT